ncbi:cytochrome P460 family protein [Roseobacter weihaiensis]|uniref:cytochrome P460 family protein n=1 Tax=Roseobacter weihaiensis TaxID=2763262 RepID=UPI001D0BA5F7|nr:cytochrome P460 family protein [Roseobacter sp. H9]
MKQKLLIIALAALGIAAYAATSLPETDRYGEIFFAYAQVDRPNGTYRRMLVTPETIAAVRKGEPLPDGTRILMESYYSQGEVGTVFHKRKVAGQWQYGSFSGSGEPNFATRPQASCISCHVTAAETDLTFTRPSLDAASQYGLSHFTCDRGGRSPCEAHVYVDGAAR